MITKKEFVSIVIPSYKGVELLEKYLPSVIQAVKYSKKNHEIIVVNDGCDPATNTLLKNRFHQVKLITLPKTFGFARSCNIGAKEARHSLVLFLNNDVKVSRDFLDPIIQVHNNSDEIFAVIPKIVVLNTGINESVYNFTFKSGYFMPQLLPQDMASMIENEFPVPFGCGAAILVNKEKFFKMGGFDTIYHPYYWEDVDIGYRAWKRGWQVIYQPESIVYHQKGATIGDGSRNESVDIVFLRNMILFTWKNIHSRYIAAKHMLTVPVDLMFAKFSRRKNYIKAFREAKKLFLRSQHLRRKERSEIVYSDRELLNYFRNNFRELSKNKDIREKEISKTIFRMPDEVKNILIIQNYGGIGDILLSTPVIITLKKNFPEVRISYMLDSKLVDVVYGIPQLDDIIPYEKDADKKLKFNDLIKSIREKNFDMSIVLWDNKKDAFLCFLSGIRYRIGQSDRLTHSFLYNIKVSVRSAKGDLTTHWVDIMLDYIRIMNFPEIVRKVSFYISQDDDKYIEKIMNEKELSENDMLIGIHLGKGLKVTPEIWPVEKFAKSADILVQKLNAKIIFTGSNDEIPLVKTAQSLMNYPSYSFAGKTNLKQLGALIRRMTVFICPDSGPMHIAASLKVPCVGIFALKSDYPMRWHPFGTSYRIVRSFPHNCINNCIKEKCQKFDCLNDIDEYEIVNAVISLIKK